jgi:hypothetical protein
MLNARMEETQIDGEHIHALAKIKNLISVQ